MGELLHGHIGCDGRNDRAGDSDWERASSPVTEDGGIGPGDPVVATDLLRVTAVCRARQEHREQDGGDTFGVVLPQGAVGWGGHETGRQPGYRLPDLPVGGAQIVEPTPLCNLSEVGGLLVDQAGLLKGVQRQEEQVKHLLKDSMIVAHGCFLWSGVEALPLRTLLS